MTRDSDLTKKKSHILSHTDREEVLYCRFRRFIPGSGCYDVPQGCQLGYRLRRSLRPLPPLVDVSWQKEPPLAPPPTSDASQERFSAVVVPAIATERRARVFQYESTCEFTRVTYESSDGSGIRANVDVDLSHISPHVPNPSSDLFKTHVGSKGVEHHPDEREFYTSKTGTEHSSGSSRRPQDSPIGDSFLPQAVMATSRYLPTSWM